MFVAETYTPGAPWTSPDFITRALALPRIKETLATAGAATTPSYFEHRWPNGDAVVHVSAYPGQGGTLTSVVLERREDEDEPWRTVATYSAATEADYSYQQFCQLRLRLVTGSGVVARLHQDQ